ncbi:GntR family transcriptional regulator [Marivivens niveibacter]|uniref:GntR family transcriptional regulator n=1 Tax=Marivivens niveibacter TaxID=1930667 RepID=A0A251WY09_9RHOB|nr:GntR family transcriptional regulator [Marivivens niveibacter]OUD08823.1 GntR family transcriptional regulator [Marivivens niveibacter]
MSKLGDDIYRAMRHDIVFGKLEAQSKIRLSNLKETYGASVPTLREILNRLVSEGFVLAEGQRGHIVTPMSAEGLREIADLRILLESSALEKSIQRGDLNWEERIISAHYRLAQMEKQMQAGDDAVREAWKKYDWEYHQALISACGSSELLSLHGITFDKYLRYQMRLLTFRGEVAADEHKLMRDAALDRDAKTAVALLRAHILGGVEHSLQLFR